MEILQVSLGQFCMFLPYAATCPMAKFLITSLDKFVGSQEMAELEQLGCAALINGCISKRL